MSAPVHYQSTRRHCMASKCHNHLKHQDIPVEKLTNSHAHADISSLNHLGELLEADLAVLIEIGLHDSLVHDLLQLLVLKVAANHHLEDNEKLSIADVTITVNVVDLEGELKLLFLVALATECRKACHELLEIDITTTILIEDGNHSERDPG
ncbi:hypothetical protein HG530_002902 [Fusarium avenaceum]|nr:hypothetical protein HG530_002902 [Fusarium avenaceum]